MASSNFTTDKQGFYASSEEVEENSSAEMEDVSIVKGPNKRKRRRKKPLSHIQSTCQMDVSRIEALLDVKFIDRKDGPTFSEMKNSSIEDVLQHILDFAYGERKSDSEEVLSQFFEQVFKLKGSTVDRTQFLQENGFLHRMKELQYADFFAVFMRLQGYTNEDDFILVKALFTDLAQLYDKLVHSKRQNTVVTNLHESVKAIVLAMANVCCYTSNQIKISGDCRMEYFVTTKTEGTFEKVTAKPDFVFGFWGNQESLFSSASTNEYTIPVQVYSPSAEDAESSMALNSDPESSNCDDHFSTSSNSSCRRKFPQSKYLPCLSDMPDLSSENVYQRFKNKIAGQHVAQLYGVAEAIFRQSNISTNDEVMIIGMFFMNEYCFFSKMKVNYSHLLATSKVKQLRGSEYLDNVPQVEFFPTALDITQAEHLFAILAFLKERKLHFVPEPTAQMKRIAASAKTMFKKDIPNYVD